MSGMSKVAGRILRRVSPTLTINLEEMLRYRAEVYELKQTVDELKREIDELRRDSLRVAELSDVVVEQLAAARAEAREDESKHG